ncbi:M16 family metallopeptidase [Sneathiella aquimaris]|uniref:M16 family metallopeptidase n=1 Tax=Sneathiella aquimaris TaxID=2599305 RepID=UPI00146D79B3|nr:pitrilysin family protein [Sneathiella aquimaris]
MKKLVTRVIVFCVLSGALISAALADTGKIPTLFEPKTTTLENGMDVVVIEDHRAPVVTHMVWYRAGSADEPAGKSGIAHFLEHLMFKGTKKIPSGQFSAIVAQNGGQDNAFTSSDYTAYYQNASVDKLPLLMEMEADRMTNLILSDDAVGAELQVVLEERSQRTDNNPNALLGEQMSAAQFLAHPYGIPVIGWRHEIEQLTTQDAINWYKKHYAPNNAILVVAGDVDANDVFDLARKYYGPAKPIEIEPRVRLQEPPQLAKRILVMKDKRVREPSWRQVYLAPSARTGDLGEVRALEVLTEILGGGVTSRLYSRLVIDEKIAASVGSYYRAGSFDPSGFTLYGVPSNGIELEQLEEKIAVIVADVVENGVTEEEVTRAKKQLLAAAIYARDSISGAANIFGGALASGETLDNIVNWPAQINQVTAEQIQQAAKKVFVDRQSVVGHLLPEGK